MSGLTLTDEQYAFLRRAQAYCEEGLTQSEMAAREGVLLTSFRVRLLSCGFTINSDTRRRLVRTGSGEAFEPAGAAA